MNLAKYTFFLLLITQMFLTSCFTARKPTEQDKVQKYRLNQAGAALLEASVALLAADGKVPLAEREQLRSAFNQALYRYRQLSGTEEVEFLRLNGDGVEIVLPVKELLAASKGGIEPEIVGESLTGLFAGELLDMTWLTLPGNTSSYLALFFADSLVVSPWPATPSASNIAFKFEAEQRHKERPARLTGMIRPLSGTATTTRLQLYSSVLQESLEFSFDGERLEIANAGHFPPLALQSVAGQSFLESNAISDEPIVVLREISPQSAWLLDASGHLSSVDPDSSGQNWESKTPVGSGLFPLADALAAITLPDNRFCLYALDNTPQLLGMSPVFKDNIAAVAPLEWGHDNGFLVATSAPGTGRIQQTQLHFLDEDEISWNTEAPRITLDYPASGKSLRYYDGTHFGPVSTRHPLEFPASIGEMLFENLVVIDEAGNPKPQMAAHVTATDRDRVWQIRLRDNLLWSNGRKLTASDVKSAWENTIRWCSDNQPGKQWVWNNIAGYSSLIEQPQRGLSGVRVVDESVFEIKLNIPDPMFAEKLAMKEFCIYRKESRQSTYTGCGPFVFEAARSAGDVSMVHLTPNRFYNHGKPSLSAVEVFFPGISVAEHIFDLEHSVARLSHMPDHQYFSALSGYQVVNVERAALYFLVLNPRSPALNKQANRVAVTNVLGGNNLLARVLDEYGASAAISIIRGSKGQRRNTSAQSSFAHAVSIAYNQDDPIAARIALRLAAQLKKHNIPFNTPRGMRLSELNRLKSSHRYDVLVDRFVSQTHSAASQLFEFLDDGFYLGTRIKQDLENLRQDMGSRKKAYAIEEHLLQQVLFYPLVHTRISYALPTELRDVEVGRGGILDLAGSWFPADNQHVRK